MRGPNSLSDRKAVIDDNNVKASDDQNVTHFVFLVHGTWGKASDGWYRPSTNGERFADRLAAAFEGTPLAGAVWRDTKVFEWSGDNTHAARLEAAERLEFLLYRLRRRYSNPRFHFVAHSHGGNVVLQAIQNYLLRLPVHRLNRLGFPRKVKNAKTRQQFLAAARQFIEFWNTHPGQRTIARHTRLVEDARRWVEGLEKAAARYSAANDRLLRIADLLLRLGTHREEHCISSVVFLGTPFYYKRWKPSRHLRARILTGLAQSLLFGLAAYVVLVAGGALLAAMSNVALPGMNLFEWHWALQSALAAVVAWTWIRGFRREVVTVDGNVYFDEGMFTARSVPSEAFTELGDRTLFDALVISSGFLDEALAGLASIPWLQRGLPDLVDRFLAPLKWERPILDSSIGRVPNPLEMLMIEPLRVVWVLAVAGLKWLLYPIRITAYRLFTRPLALSQAARVSLPLAYGLAAPEFATGAIRVSNDLEIPHIRVQTIDVSRDLAAARSSPDNADAQRFEFLWDDGALAERWAGSIASSQFGNGVPKETQRTLLAVEERMREVYGVAGVRHSLYYENPKVLQAVAGYLIATSEQELRPL